MTDPKIENPAVDERTQRIESTVARAFRGLHHVRRIKRHSATFWEVNVFDGISTFDHDTLTRLVIAAHDYAVRVELSQSGPGQIKIHLHARKREGAMHERHPTIEQAIEQFRGGSQ